MTSPLTNSRNKKDDVIVNFKRGHDKEDEFEKLLIESSIHYERESFFGEQNLKADFKVEHIFCVEISIDSSHGKIQQMCYRAKVMEEEGLNPVAFVKVADLSDKDIRIISESFYYVFDMESMPNFISLLLEGKEKDKIYNEDIAEKAVNSYYLASIMALRKKSKKHEMLYSAMDVKFREMSENDSLGLDDDSHTPTSAMEESDSEKDSENLDIILKDVFKKMDLVDSSKKLLNTIKKNGGIESSSNLYKDLGVSYSQYYDTILKRLKSRGLIRKQGKYYILDSRYSLRNIKHAAVWIEYSNITKKQPKELAKVILSLFGLEGVVK